MKKFFKIMAKDYLKENFTAEEWLIYGVLYPLIVIAAAIAVSILEDMVNNNYL